jgi:hypothetical protein
MHIRLLTHDPPPLILLPPLLHRQNFLSKCPPDGTQPIGVGRVRRYPNHNAPVEPDLVCGSDDRGGADAEDFEERPGGRPPFEVGEGKGAFSRVERRPCRGGPGGGRGGGDGRAKRRVRDEGETRRARDAGQNRPIQRRREDVPT